VRSIELTVDQDRTNLLLEELRSLDPIGLRVYRGASLHPPGDQISLEVPNDDLGRVMRIADAHGLGEPGGVSMTTSVPLSVVSHAYAGLTREAGRTTWEELELSIGEDSTMSLDRVVVMAIAGFIAGIGIVSGTLHVVIGAMVIAPGFQPFSRFVLGLINRSHAWRGGLTDVLRAYGALTVGATLAAVTSLLFGSSALDAGHPSYLASDTLVSYWTTTSWTGIAVGGVAAICGGLLISINRTVLTAGVMVALALVPSAVMVPMGLVAGDPGMAASALARFLAEVALVLGGSALVFTIKHREDRRSAVDSGEQAPPAVLDPTGPAEDDD
jgi:hypothetical protein